MLLCVCSVIDHRGHQNVIFDVICDLLLNRHTATWNLFVNQNPRQQSFSKFSCGYHCLLRLFLSALWHMEYKLPHCRPFHTPYSKIAANKLFFCLHVD